MNSLSNTKKEDFRKYLERNGIVDALTKVLVGLYEHPEKPENPLEYIQQFLQGPSNLDVEQIKVQNLDLLKQVNLLTTQIDQLHKYITDNNLPIPTLTQSVFLDENPNLIAEATTAAVSPANPNST